MDGTISEFIKKFTMALINVGAAVSFVKYVSRKNSCLPAVTLRNVKSGGAEEEVVWVEEHRIFECRKRLKKNERERSKNDITSTPSSTEIFDPSLTDDPGLDATSPHNKHFTFHFTSFEDLISDSRFDPTRARRSLTSCAPRRAGTPYLMFVLRTPLGRRCGADLALMCAEDGLSHVAVLRLKNQPQQQRDGQACVWSFPFFPEIHVPSLQRLFEQIVCKVTLSEPERSALPNPVSNFGPSAHLAPPSPRSRPIHPRARLPHINKYDLDRDRIAGPLHSPPRRPLRGGPACDPSECADAARNKRATLHTHAHFSQESGANRVTCAAIFFAVAVFVYGTESSVCRGTIDDR
ncbi:hypothetical protein GEV33_006929 [Tenebrio molitor]|uniref:Uncharacterized protein n=1 Tax=Tenebrio molitor TaxID=7067 RepID=A0A8J6HK98_TENMO|nr:hypothetical protein GEV33_006929 [Tenebrio molitor]